MHAKDIFLFLIGNRGSIERIAGSWWALLIGAILVLTAGIARNYDHLDLLRDPEWIIGPFIASIITSSIIFVVVKTYLGLYGSKVRIKWRQYVSFLCLYWMTSPCAWLYGLPVESYTDLVTATKWNIAFLAIVSIWRVALMTRSLAVLTKASYGVSLLGILLPASAIMCVGSFFKGLSLVGIMGGVRLPPHTKLLQEAAGFTAMASFWITIVAMIAAPIIGRKFARASRQIPWRTEKAPWLALFLACLCLILWAGAGRLTQVKVQRNHHLTELIKQHQYADALSYASQYKLEDFSTIHYFPPNPYTPSYHGNRSEYRELISRFDGSEPAWLRETWIRQYATTLLNARMGLSEEDHLLIKSIPELREIIEREATEEENQRLLESLNDSHSGQNSPPLMDGSAPEK